MLREFTLAGSGLWRRSATVTAVALAAWASGCLERPVSTDVEVRFPAGDAAEITVETRLTTDSDLLKNQAVSDRVEAEARDLLDGQDPWGRRFGRLSPDREILLEEKSEGRLVRVRRTAHLSDPRSLADAFAGTGVTALYASGDGIEELGLYVSGAPPATEAERARYRAETGPWLEALSRWLAAADALYGYLDANPARAEACFGLYFKDILGSREEPPAPPTDAESDLVRALDEAGNPLAAALMPEQGESVSFDELVQRLHDPLPGGLTLRVEGEVLETEGLDKTADGALRAPSRGLWDAFERLVAQYVSPNPLAAFVSRVRDAAEEDAPFPLENFSAARRAHAHAPDAATLGAELEKELTPPPVYRVRFRRGTVAAAAR
jgi:hypothetical protein